MPNIAHVQQMWPSGAMSHISLRNRRGEGACSGMPEGSGMGFSGHIGSMAGPATHALQPDRNPARIVREWIYEGRSHIYHCDIAVDLSQRVPEHTNAPD